MTQPLVISDRVVIPGRDLHWEAVRAAGPGGQNVNKVASKVELRFDLAATAVLDEETKARLRALAGSRLDAEGRVLVVSQRTRDQGRNLEDALEKLRALVQQALHRPRTRRPTRPSRGARERRMADKRHQGERKRARQGRPED